MSSELQVKKQQAVSLVVKDFIIKVKDEDRRLSHDDIKRKVKTKFNIDINRSVVTKTLLIKDKIVENI